MKNYYVILQVLPTASQDEIKSAYRRLVIAYHPDKNNGSKYYSDLFVEVQEAFDILGDENRRKSFDAQLNKFYLSQRKSKEESTSKKETTYRTDDYSSTYKGTTYNYNRGGNDGGRNYQAPKYATKSSENDGCTTRIVSWGVVFLFFVIIGKIGDSCNGCHSSSNTMPKVEDNSAYSATNNTGYNANNPPSAYNYPSAPTSSSNKIKPVENEVGDDYSDWNTTNYQSGETPACAQVYSKFDYNINNYLKVSVDNSTDVVIKLIGKYSNRCIRCVYIRSGTSYFLRNIPEGEYYTKIEYGDSWKEKTVNGKCNGKFTLNRSYKKGLQTLNYNKQYEGVSNDGTNEYSNYSIPSYSLSLGVVRTGYDSDKYDSYNINEKDFDE